MPCKIDLCSYSPVKSCDALGINQRFSLLFEEVCALKNTGNSYILPIATSSILGGIKVGTGLTIDPITGILSTTIVPTQELFQADITVSLAGGKTLGRYTNGQVIESQGLTAEEVINLLAHEYSSPTFSSFLIQGQATTVEVGTVLTTPATFVWGINTNSGIVNTIDIKDVTAGTTLVSNTPNDLSQSVALGPVTFTTAGATRIYKGTLHDTGTSPSDVDSLPFTVTGRFYRFWGAVAIRPANSAAVRSLNSGFQVPGNTFVLTTGTTQNKFSVNLPPGVTITSVIDTGNLNVNITSEYVLVGTVIVTDAGGSARVYNQYEMNTAVPYNFSTTHSITTS